MPLAETTVLIGPNNAGKTAVLEAIRIALTRRWGQRGTGFTEYDIRLEREDSDPKSAPPIEIELEVVEIDPWPETIHDELTNIIQPDPITGKGTIILRVSCKWDGTEQAFVPRWEFLNVHRNPLTGAAAKAINLEEFFKYLPTFYLDALRDADQEYSARSQFWGRLLRAIKVPSELANEMQSAIDQLNDQLLGSDAKISKITDTLESLSTVTSSTHLGKIQLRALPLKPWDIMSRSEVIYRTEDQKPFLPLTRHGQGVQSLSVVFLFKAFIQLALAEHYKPDSVPLLQLEEPETHLHPQAVRALWKQVSELPGQKIVTSHSPYFIQHVPFRDLRILRMTEDGTSVCYLPQTFQAKLPLQNGLKELVARSSNTLSYSDADETLQCAGQLKESLKREILTLYSSRRELHSAIANLAKESSIFVSDEDLAKLDEFARRIRGEIFFARKWFLVEGQSEYLLLQGLATALNYNLDQNGIAVIDCQNSGSPGIFAALARGLSIPFVAVFDGDDAGRQFIEQIKNYGFSDAFIAQHCHLLPGGPLEQQLIADNLQTELQEILREIDSSYAPANDQELLVILAKNKTAVAAKLGKRCESQLAFANRMPLAFRESMEKLKTL